LYQANFPASTEACRKPNACSMGLPKAESKGTKKRGAGGVFRLPELHVNDRLIVLLQWDYTAAG